MLTHDQRRTSAPAVGSPIATGAEIADIAPSGPLLGLHGLGQLRQDLVQIADDAEV